MPATSQASAQKDNLLGVCHALGEAFGFDPFLLRVTLAVALMIRPGAVLIGYGVVGLLVLTSRVVVRRAKPRQPVRRPAVPAGAVPTETGGALPLAA